MLRPIVISALVVIASVVMVVWSGRLVGGDIAWWSNALLTLGSAAGLATAFFWLNRTLEAHLERRVDEQVGEVRESVSEQAAVIEDVRADVADQQQTIDDLVREKLQRTGQELPSLARQAAEAHSPSAMADAIRLARKQNTLGDLPPMVPVKGAPGYWVRVDAADQGLKLVLGHPSRPPGDRVLLRDDDAAEGLTVLGDQICAVQPEFREDLDLPRIFERVADVLTRGASHSYRFGLFGRVGGWGALPGYVVSLGSHPPMVRIDAARGEKYIVVQGRGLSENEKRLIREACALAADPDAMFRDASPKSSI